MKKRAVIGVQFNWILILIVGGIILFFFLNIIGKQKETTEMSVSNEMLKYFDTIITGLDVELGVSDNISLEGTALKVKSNTLSIAGSRLEGKSFQNRIVFSPDLIEGEKLVTYTEYWEMPFKIDYFIFLTSNELRYIIVDDDPSENYNIKVENLRLLIPSSVSIEVIDSIKIDEVEDTNNYKVRFIFFDKDPETINDIGELNTHNDVSAIMITPAADSESLNTYGTVKYYKKARRSHSPSMGTVFELTGTSYYLKEESLLGAVISENKEYYDEQMKKALKKLGVIAEIYKDNAMELKIYSTNNYDLLSKNCPPIYKPEKITDIIEKAKSGILYDNFMNIYQNAKDVDLSNNLLKKSSCILLY